MDNREGEISEISEISDIYNSVSSLSVVSNSQSLSSDQEKMMGMITEMAKILTKLSRLIVNMNDSQNFPASPQNTENGEE